MRFEVFENLAQDALPIPGVMPKNGDKIILNYLYSRAVIVAPNESVYKQVIEHFKNITFISPDVAAAYLADIHSPSPNRTDFRNICYQNAAGLIFIAFDGEGFLQIVEVLKHFILLKVAKFQAICAHFIQMFVKFQSIFGISTTDKLEITRNIIES